MNRNDEEALQVQHVHNGFHIPYKALARTH
jgi:hypothetical protein